MASDDDVPPPGFGFPLPPRADEDTVMATTTEEAAAPEDAGGQDVDWAERFAGQRRVLEEQTATLMALIDRQKALTGACMSSVHPDWLLRLLARTRRRASSQGCVGSSLSHRRWRRPPGASLTALLSPPSSLRLSPTHLHPPTSTAPSDAEVRADVVDGGAGRRPCGRFFTHVRCGPAS